MSKIIDYSAAAALDASAVFLINNGDAGTQKIVATKLLQALAEISDDVQIHRNVWGGRNLGTSVTTEQWAQINAGTFHGMLVGDYWVIGGVKWVIADFDYWLHCGWQDNVTGNGECTKHHVIIIPETILYNAKMNETNIVTGAYIGSQMYTANLAQAKTTINDAFGSAHILNHREQLANAVTDGRETGHVWVDSTVEIMNESMVYGTERFHNQVQGTAWAEYHTIDKTQLAIFRLDPTKIVAFNSSNQRAYWWLRDVVTSTNFACVSATGYAGSNNASNSLGVRPAFGICAA